jgi:hypothetical protein
MIRKALIIIGLEGKKYGAHSLRAGGATDLFSCRCILPDHQEIWKVEVGYSSYLLQRSRTYNRNSDESIRHLSKMQREKGESVVVVIKSYTNFP